MNALTYDLTVAVAFVAPMVSLTVAAGVSHAVVAGSKVAVGCDVVTGAESDSDIETVRNSAFDM